MTEPVLTTDGLTVAYRGKNGTLNTVVRDVELSLRPGEVTALAGESGSGKSTTALAAIGYRAPSSVIQRGRSTFEGKDLLELPIEQLRSIWGRKIAFLAQNASGALNPAIRVGRQLEEVITRHTELRGADLKRRKLELFEAIGLPAPAPALRRYPHEFSGGQQQRIAIAIALACRPSVLIMDEPTTGLDVTTQKQISSLLRRLIDETGAAALYVSHDIALLGEVADRLYVMYGGEVAETAAMHEVTSNPRHPYTRALLDAVPSARSRTELTGIPGAPPPSVARGACAFAPRCSVALDKCTEADVKLIQVASGHEVRCVRAQESVLPDRMRRAGADHRPAARNGTHERLLDVQDLWCHYGPAQGGVQAVAGVSLTVSRGEAVGIVGESGSGKTTLVRTIIGLHVPHRGRIVFSDSDLAPRAVDRARDVRSQIQLVFQNPKSALNPRHTILETVSRPARVILGMGRDDAKALAEEMVDAVHLPRSVLGRYPRELSGGQQQRVAIARAFSTRPALLLLDEVTASLDVSVQATIIELMGELRRRFGVTLVFVSHDLAVVRSLCDRAIVMKDGEVCEQGELEQLFSAPQAEYTRKLVAAIPQLV